MPQLRADIRAIPALPFGAAIAGGAAAALYIDAHPDTLLWFAVGAGLIAAACAAVPRLRTPAIVAALFSFAALGMTRASADLNRGARRAVEAMADQSQEVIVFGRVERIAETNGGRVLVLENATLRNALDSVHCGNLRLRLVIDSTAGQGLQPGDLVAAAGRIAPLSERLVYGRGALIAAVTRGEGGTVSARSETLVREAGTGYTWRKMIARVRGRILETLDGYLTRDAAAIGKALLLGERGDFSPVFAQQLRVTGLSHVFALSGVNVGIMATLLWAAVSLLFLPRTARYLIVLAGLIVYMELGEEAPSLVRATLMAGFYILGRVLYRNSSILNAVAAAALVELFWRPLHIVDAGFLLSYLAVLGLIGLFPFVQSILLRIPGLSPRGATGSLASIAALTIAAQIATLPLAGFLFHRMTFAGVLGNLAAVPVFGVLLIWSLLLLATAAVVPSVAIWVAAAMDAAVFAVGRLVDILARMPAASLIVGSFHPLVLAGMYAALLVAILGLWLRHWRMTATGVLALCSLIVWPGIFAVPRPDCTVAFVAVGNGDAAIISARDGTHVLIDAGPAFEDWSAASRIVPYLNETGIDELDAVFLTHPDNDHIGGVIELLEQIPVRAIYHNGDTAWTRTFLTAALAAKQQDIEMRSTGAGDVFRCGNSISLRVLSPDSLLRESRVPANRKSLVLRLETADASMLLTADADTINERLLAEWGALLNVDVLKIGHHGSASSTSRDFLAATSPVFCVISAGRKSQYGFPAAEVIERLRALNIPHVSTAERGTIILQTGKAGWIQNKPPAVQLARRWKLPDA